jgi:hypothetical protein
VSSNEDCALTVTFLPHRKLQEDLTGEMVELARQPKESSLTMNQSMQETNKVFYSDFCCVDTMVYVEKVVLILQ